MSHTASPMIASANLWTICYFKLFKSAGLLIFDFQQQSRGRDVPECLHAANRAEKANVKFTNRVR